MKSKVIILSIIIIVVVLAFGGYVTFLNHRPSATEQNLTNGLGVYDNFGIKFQYPKEWGAPQESIFGSLAEEQINFASKDSSGSPFSINIQPNYADKSGKAETFNQMMTALVNNKNVASSTNISSNGVNGKEIIYKYDATPTSFNAYFPINDQSFVVFTGDSSFSTEDGFDKVISTFSLDGNSVVKTDTKNGDLIYSNNGIRLDYPGSFNSDYASLNLQTIISVGGDKKVDSNGCYLAFGSSGKAAAAVWPTIGGRKFCMTQGGDVGAGQLYESYYYTTQKNGIFYTIAYVVHTSNGCGVYENSPDVNAPGNERYKACMAFQTNYGSIVLKPIQDSISTFKFIN